MSVTVIIPTTCETRRGSTLQRAILSVADQLPAGGSIQVVANGDRVDESVARMAERLPHVALHRLPEANVAAAQRLGRRLVTTEFFCFLDDDDEYLPNAFDIRIAALRSDGAVDAVVTNGYTHVGDRDFRRLDRLDYARKDALRALLEENWLASCGATYRSATVGVNYFDGNARFFEWTLLAYKLAGTRTIRFVDVPTYRVYVTPDSASSSRAYREAELDVLGAIARMDIPADVRRAIRKKMGNAEHGLSAYFLRQGDWSRAVRHHWRSLGCAGGLKFLAYTRKLIRARRNA
jgi:glycosyltransferase involved in cell wall biosynthesis